MLRSNLVWDFKWEKCFAEQFTTIKIIEECSLMMSVKKSRSQRQVSNVFR